MPDTRDERTGFDQPDDYPGGKGYLMTGTEWTEPGQGATRRKIAKLHGRGCICGWSRQSERAHNRRCFEPLTAEDLKRIEQCEVTR